MEEVPRSVPSSVHDWFHWVPLPITMPTIQYSTWKTYLELWVASTSWLSYLPARRDGWLAPFPLSVGSEICKCNFSNKTQHIPCISFFFFCSLSSHERLSHTYSRMNLHEVFCCYSKSCGSNTNFLFFLQLCKSFLPEEIFFLKNHSKINMFTLGFFTLHYVQRKITQTTGNVPRTWGI